MAQQIDLAKMFGAAAKALAASQTSLNDADTGNHDHGDNMVETFEVITQAMKAKKGADPADQLAYASELLRQKTKSGSGKVYASNLEQAAQTFKDKVVTPDNAAMLVQMLMGAGQQGQQAGGTAQPAGGGDLVGSLLSGFLGGGQAAPAQPAQAPADQGLDVGDLVNAGLSFLQAKQSGQSDTEALIGALASGTSLGQTPHRAQSGALVAQALMSAVSAMAKK